MIQGTITSGLPTHTDIPMSKAMYIYFDFQATIFRYSSKNLHPGIETGLIQLEYISFVRDFFKIDALSIIIDRIG